MMMMMMMMMLMIMFVPAGLPEAETYRDIAILVIIVGIIIKNICLQQQ